MYTTTIFLLIFAVSLSQCQTKLSICFYTNWAQYRNGNAKFVPDNIDVSLCSHISYAFAKIDLQTHKVEPYEWNDAEMMAKIIALKSKKPSLEIILSIGGWNHEFQPRYSKMVATNSTRKIFIDSVLAYLNQYKLDGVSLDWEYPGNRGSPPEDKERFTYLLKEFREAIDNSGCDYTLTTSVGAGRPVIAAAYQISDIAQYVDWVNLMSYDLHGSWENITGHSTAMTGPIPTVPDSLSVWLQGGMPHNKIVLGLAAYGRSFTLKYTNETGLGVPVTGPGLAGQYTRAAGSLAYYEVCAVDWTTVTTWEASAASAPYASRTNQWIGYETPESIAHKVKTLVNGYNLHGFSLWALDFDDFTGTFCNRGTYPILKAALNAMDNDEQQHIQFHPSHDKQACVATPKWKHLKSIDNWCKQRCIQVKDCPKWMCICL